MSKNNKSIINVSAAVLFNQKGEILLSTRPKNKSFSGFWEFAGGKIENKETAFSALRREVYEELDLQVLNATPWLCKTIEDQKSILNLFFWRVRYLDWIGKIQPQEKQDIQWILPNENIDLLLLPNNKSIFLSLCIPEKLRKSSDLLITGKLYSETEEFKIIHYYQSQSNEDKIWIEFDVLQKIGKMPLHRWNAIEVSTLREYQKSLDANAIIWFIKDQSSFSELELILKNGQYLPILALNFNKEQKRKLTQLGIHGFIESSEVIFS